MSSDPINPLSNLAVEAARQKQLIADIEYALDLTPKRQLTGDAIGRSADRIDEVIAWIRSSTGNTVRYNAGREAVLTYLRNASKKLNAAVVEYDRKGVNEKVFDYVEAGRKELEKALHAW